MQTPSMAKAVIARTVKQFTKIEADGDMIEGWSFEYGEDFVTIKTAGMVTTTTAIDHNIIETKNIDENGDMIEFDHDLDQFVKVDTPKRHDMTDCIKYYQDGELVDGFWRAAKTIDQMS